MADGTSGTSIDGCFSLLLEPVLSARPLRVAAGIASLIGEVGPSDGSGTYDDAEERSDRMLVRVVRIEGSELAEDAAGESRPRSDDGVLYGDGDCVSSETIFGDDGLPRMTSVFVARGTGNDIDDLVGVSTGMMGIGATPGVGGGASGG